MGLLSIVWKRKWVVVALVAVTAIASLARSRSEPRVYEARAKVLIRGGTGGLGFGTLAQFSSSSANIKVNDYAEILKSRTFMEETAVRLGMADLDSTEFARMRAALSVQMIPASNVIEIRVRTGQARKAMRIANAAVANLQYRSLAIQKKDVRTALQAVQTELTSQKKRLTEAETALENLGRKASPGTKRQAAQAERDLMVAEAIGMNLQEQEAELRLAGISSRGEVEVIERASLPRNHLRPRTLINLYVAAFWGLVAGVGLALLWESIGKVRRASA